MKLPSIDGMDAWNNGFCTALAESYRAHGDSSITKRIAKEAGLTLDRARRSGVPPYDLTALRRAGIP